jgi:(2Fe-2S) ferredoxin
MRVPYRMHLLPCTGKTCGAEHGEALKQRLKELLPDRKALCVRVSTSSCQGLCERGPNLLVYPEGWVYHRTSIERLDRIVEEHVRGGRPVEEYLRDPLPPPTPVSEAGSTG